MGRSFQFFDESVKNRRNLKKALTFLNFKAWFKRHRWFEKPLIFLVTKNADPDIQNQERRQNCLLSNRSDYPIRLAYSLANIWFRYPARRIPPFESCCLITGVYL